MIALAEPACNQNCGVCYDPDCPAHGLGAAVERATYGAALERLHDLAKFVAARRGWDLRVWRFTKPEAA